ncbi:metallophosphoesterase family protein [Undibacterium sp. Ren11W]|uniref:metallophosphoesterase family protein n=1 Tax=Undibacterium sp. Ren11W TaxID=3413045 RepID=UPI003BEF628A
MAVIFKSRLRAVSSSIVILITLAACSTPSQNTTTTSPAEPLTNDGPILAAWVVMGEQGQAQARAITTASECPELSQDGVSKRMQLRAGAASIAQRKTVSSAADSKASLFEVNSCEADLQASVKTASIAGRVLPLPKALPQKIIVIGDTGCRLQKGSNYFQECNDAAKWAFAQVAKTAASFQPDLVIHVGDYHYRENACSPGNSSCASSPWGYGWDTWRADFFTPAAALLAAAPWVVVRGNHESCGRAGQGWWRFMDPRPLQAGRDCNREADDLQGDYSAPYAIPLGTMGGQSAQLIVFDSAKVPGQILEKTSSAYQIYSAQLQAADQLAEQAQFSIFMNHHPILGFAPAFTPGNPALQDLMQQSHPERLFPPKVQATLAGHVHLFEAITFASDHPSQFVAGNGGSSLDQALPNQIPAGATPYAKAAVAHFSNSNQAGFMTMERVGANWKMQAWDQHGKPLTSCLMQDGKTTCKSAL